MKVLMVITSLDVGGAERQVLDVANKLSEQGHSLCIAYLVGAATLKPLSADVQLVSLGAKKNIFGFVLALLRLARHVHTFKPDVVHSHMFHANIMARLVRIVKRFPRLICTAHSTNEGGGLRMFAYRVTDRLADISTNVSCQAVREFERRKAVPIGRMIPVLNGIDTDRYRFNEAERHAVRKELKAGQSKILLAVGRLYDAKDYPNLLTAFALITEYHPEWKLWVVGDGPLHGCLEIMLEKLSLENNVSFLGIRHDVERIMSAADVFVLSSKWEGFGLVVAEAMATERVVVATDCGGVAEVLGTCGFLAPAQDPRALSEVLKQAMELSSEEIGVLGSQARQRILSGFSIDSAVDRWINIYRNDECSVVRSDGRRPSSV